MHRLHTNAFSPRTSLSWGTRKNPRTSTSGFLGGEVIKPENPCYIKLANTWIILNSGGGPTPDKPEVFLETPWDLNRVNSFLNLRVADIWACYKEWGDKGAIFLTEPLDNRGWEWRCYMRDPDGYLIEVGQYTQMALERFKSYAG
jgi:hypothetical protein